MPRSWQPGGRGSASRQRFLFRIRQLHPDAGGPRCPERPHRALHRNTAAVRLEGHTDERGTREYNLALGERRANAVRDYMVANGISSLRIETVSYGEERPVAYGSGEATGPRIAAWNW